MLRLFATLLSFTAVAAIHLPTGVPSSLYDKAGRSSRNRSKADAIRTPVSLAAVLITKRAQNSTIPTAASVAPVPPITAAAPSSAALKASSDTIALKSMKASEAVTITQPSLLTWFGLLLTWYKILMMKFNINPDFSYMVLEGIVICLGISFLIYSVVDPWNKRGLMRGRMRSKARRPFSYYADTALVSTTPPRSPTWLYWTNRNWGQGTVLRASIWFTFLVPVIMGLWVSACHTVYTWSIFRYTTLFALNALQVGIVIAINFITPWPEKDKHHVNNPDYLKTIGCIVPCHQSAEQIVTTVQSLLRYFRPEHIVVVDNGNAVDPLDNTAFRLQELDARVIYTWVPIGMKTNALWVGVHKLPPTVEYVMHIDDDTELPQDMVFEERVWEHSETTAISYGITMYQTGWVEKLVDYEFKQISQWRLFQSEYSTVWFQHGIIGLWRRPAFTETLKEHPFLPFGEDNWNGTLNLLKNKQMRQELRSCAITYAPSTLLPGTGNREQGYGAANIWKQRAERWCVNAPRRFLIRLYLFIFYRHDTIIGNIVFRLLSVQHLSGIIAHLVAPMAFVAYPFSSSFSWHDPWKVFLIQLAFSWFEAFFVNYVCWRHRKDVQVDFKVCLLQPFYGGFLLSCTCYGHWRCLLWYIPFFPMRTGLYTEGDMTPELLDRIHNIETDPATGDAEIGTPQLIKS